MLSGEILKPRPWDTLLAIGVVTTLALVPLIVKAGMMVQATRTRRIRAMFGDEYDQAVDHYGDWRAAEAALIARARAEGRSLGAGAPVSLRRTVAVIEISAAAVLALLASAVGIAFLAIGRTLRHGHRS